MSNTTTTTILSAADKLLGVSSDGRLIAYDEQSGGVDTLYVLDLDNNQSYAIDSFTPSYDLINEGYATFTNVTFSENGQFLFYSEGFAGTDPASYGQLFVKDLTSPTAPVDVTPTLPDATGSGPYKIVWSSLTALAISNDGNVIVYDEDYTDFSGGNPAFYGLVVENLATGTIVEQLNSKDAGGQEDDYTDVGLSGDGRYLSFYYQGDFFIQDMQSGTQVVVPGVGGYDFVFVGGGGFSGTAIPSADQRYVAYDGQTNLGGPDNVTEVFLHDNDAPSGTPDQIISTSADGVIADNEFRQVAFSGNGEFDIFYSDATNLVPGIPANNTTYYIYIKDIATGAIRQLTRRQSRRALFLLL